MTHLQTLSSAVTLADLLRNHKWLPYLLPSRDQEEYILHESGMLPTPPSSSESLAQDPSVPTTAFPNPPHSASNQRSSSSPADPLRRLLDETSDLIDSPTATHILTLLLDTLFSHLTDHVLRTQAFKIPLPTTDPSQRVQEIFDEDPNAAKAKLATILAVVTRQAHAIGNGVPNEYVQSMEGVRELEAFAAVVYSSNFEVEVNESGKVDMGVEKATGKEEVGQAGGAEDGEQGVTGVAEGATAGGRGVVASTWRLFNSAWGRVVGVGERPLTG